MLGTLLRQLLDDGPSSDIDAEILTRSAEIEQLPPDLRSEARAELDTVVELRGLLEMLRRRSQELRALFETAGDLSSMRDVERVLQAIVRRGRQLLNTDIAYLMLVDPERGDTYMRVTEGTTGKGFSDIRLPLGAGLGGQVAAAGIPLWTRNYLADDRHEPVIDDSVTEEQVVAILGVPLRVGSKILGVLFAADRSERVFSTEEISLLSSLADHAAIAIENASRFEETRDALEQLEAAKVEIESNNRRLLRAVELHEKLMGLVVGGHDPQDLAEALRADLTAECVLVHDDRGGTLATSVRPGTVADTDALVAAVSGTDAVGWPVRRPLDGLEGAAVPIVAANQVLGTLYYLGRPLSEDDLRTVERGISAISVLLLNQRASDEADNRLRGEILADLLMQAPSDVMGIRRRASLLGVDLGQPFVLVVILPDHEVTSALRSEAGGLARAAGGLVSSYADRIVALVPQRWSSGPAREVVRRLQHIGVTAASAGPSTELSDLIDLEDRAHRAANLLVALGRVGEGAAEEELGVFGLLLSEAAPDRIRSFVGAQLDPVRRYDAEKGSDLLATMAAFFAAEGSAAGTAAALFIHVNTVYQRLERVDRLLGTGWRTGDRALEVRLALRMDRLMRPT
ncbi:helix-turn-helix domain-containing protein [Gordonia phthalatica]|uniref:GAF domain-containing protein n=1 Tax=Gordonia phthalatica TaxID=1136941 RepID=A0A0N9NEB8_9ACTN|nr:GAF domain-containing protein [Gordonia phthalatica]ALG83924.1 hypothetical protein ACH46_04610 [Gordonia phthalatica]